ncbi:MAG: AsmA family protein [Gammaproteobacteria bacterium]|jgi:AsmA protein
MKAILKVFGILFGFAIIACAALVIYISTLDPNDYKSLIAEKFQEETGRTITFEGDINVTIYPWLGLETNGITVGNAPGFGDSPFLHTDHTMVRIKFMPLLQEKYEIDTVRLYGLSVNLVTDIAGRTNWEDLVEHQNDRDQSGSGNMSLAAMVLGGVDIRDASITWDDQTNGQRAAISNFMLKTGELVFGEPIDVNMTLDAVSNKPELVADVTFTSTISYNLDNEIYDIAPLDFSMMLVGPNVPQNATDITLQSAIRINLDDETMSISNLDFNALGANLTGTINASNILDEKPALQTDINLTGSDLAVLFKVAEVEPLATQLSGLNDRSFNFSAAIDADMDADEIQISGLQANLLGSNINADLNGRNIQTDTPAMIGNFNASGPDLPTLLQVMGQLQGGADSSLTVLSNQLRGVGNRSFSFSADVDADMDDGDLDISDLQANLLGADIKGDIQASNFNSSTPIVRGTINATGPNLPSLMQLLGQVQGGAESSLTIYGNQLTGITNKAFVVNTRFDANMDTGDINLPVLSLDALGIKINGNMVASNMQSNNGSINGQLSLSGNNMGELLKALDKAELGESLQSMNLNTSINGTRTDLNISPMDLKLIFSGAQGSNSPVEMDLTATTRLNLEQETLSLNNFKVSGLGLNLSGNVNAEKIFSASEFKGDLAVASFSLRKLMQQLNQDPPNTSDPRAYESISLSSSFDGSAGHLNISKLAMSLDQSKINGSVSVTDFDNPAINIGVDIDQINADRYLPPVTDSDKARPITPETAAGAAAQLPLETLRSLNTNSELKIGQLIISNARMSDVVFAMNAKAGKIRLSPVSANLYTGNYKGDVTLDATTDVPALTFDTSLQSVDINPFMMDTMGASSVSGIGNMNLKLAARGIDSTAMISTLNGTGNINLENGILQGVDVAKVLEQVEIMIRNRRPAKINQGEQTPFDTFSSTLTINNGVASSNDLEITAPGIRITGKGTVVNLNNNTLNYNLVASADQSTATRGEEQYNIGGYSIPIKCSGNANDPSCVPDVGEIIRVAVQQEVQRQIGNVLQRALGVPATEAQEPSTPEDATQTQQQQQPTQPVDPRSGTN